MSEKEREMFEFELHFKKSFCWHPNLSNDARSENGYGFGEPVGTLLPRIPSSTPPPPSPFGVLSIVCTTGARAHFPLSSFYWFLILLSISLDYVFLLLGDNWCWSLLGLKGFTWKESPVLVSIIADLATEQERHLTTGTRADRTKRDFRCSICRTAIGQASCLTCARSRQVTSPFCG